MVIYLEPDILEYKVMWALGSITMSEVSGGDGIPAELFQILKDDHVKMLNQYANKFGKLSSGHRTRKGQFSFQSQTKATPKNVQTTIQLLKTLQARLQQYMNQERNWRLNCQHSLGCRESKGIPEKHLLLLYWLHQSLWPCGSQQLWKILKEMGIPDP